MYRCGQNNGEIQIRYEKKRKEKNRAGYMTYDATTICLSLGIASWKNFEVHS
jgi:hypothetical protein